VKTDYLTDIFAERGEQTLASKEFKAWFDANQWWLEPYAKWRGNDMLQYYIQYNLHLQLKAAADYARSKGIVVKGDVPIGVNRDSVETLTHPELFNIDCQAGAPPDAFSPLGHNWGFPTYRWENGKLTEWFRRRYQWMEQYFDAVRIDHVLGFFRIWEIPADAVYGILGHFSPALPLTVGEISYFGLPFRRDLYTRPFINDRVLEKLFGMHAQYVRDTFLIPQSYGLYALKQDYDTQRKVLAHFDGRGDENSLWIRDGLLRLIANVLFVEDPHQAEMYHPRMAAWQEPVFDALNSEEKDAYMRLYNNYFYQRHSMFWGSGAIHRLGDTLRDTRMLICAEDLGMLPDCVSPVLDTMRILTLEVQTLPKHSGYEFSHLDGYPYRSVATFATHDMAPLRLWWEESPERTQRYYVTMLQKEGRAPERLPAHIAEEIIARHLYCPSMLCLLSLQDWLAMDMELRRKNPREERINVPSDPYNRWQWRMHLTIEQLMKADKYNNKVRTMVIRSKR
jgi:4-alpha-glucanotransferase